MGTFPHGTFSLYFGSEVPLMELTHSDFYGEENVDHITRRVQTYDAKTMYEGRELYGDEPGQVEVIESALPNASMKELVSVDLENRHRTELEVLRNAIYARHGLSFKDSRLRRFFESHPQYIPTHTMKEVEGRLSDLEKKNIELILRYEKNAKRFYKRISR